MSHCTRLVSSRTLSRTFRLVHDGTQLARPSSRFHHHQRRAMITTTKKEILSSTTTTRRLQSSSSSSTPSGGNNSNNKPETKEVPLLSNIILASALLMFVTGVFTYSMNAVGRNGGVDENDPLAQLRAEAEDVRTTDVALLHRTKKMTQEEIDRLESGRVDMSDDDNNNDLQEEEMAMMAKESNNGKKGKKPWWRFGF